MLVLYLIERLLIIFCKWSSRDGRGERERDGERVKGKFETGNQHPQLISEMRRFAEEPFMQVFNAQSYLARPASAKFLRRVPHFTPDLARLITDETLEFRMTLFLVLKPAVCTYSQDITKIISNIPKIHHKCDRTYSWPVTEKNVVSTYALDLPADFLHQMS